MPVIPFEFGRNGRPVIRVAARHEPPFPVDAVVEEDDTFHVLSGGPAARAVEDDPLRVLSRAHAAQPAPPGSVIVRPGRPLRLLAVVHDLAEDPTCREAWVALAYRGVLSEVAARGIEAIAMSLLGTVHGRFDPDRSRALLDDAIDAGCPGSLRRVWLVAHPS